MRPVIFIHGFIGSLDFLKYPTESSAPDMLGYGKEQGAPFESITLQGQVEYLKEFIENRYHGQVVDIVGHSVGGAIAMLFAHSYPNSVRKIVNVEGNFTLGDAFWSGSVGRMNQEEAEAMLNGFRANPVAWIGKSVATVNSEISKIASRWLAFQAAATLRAMGRSVVETTGNEKYLEALSKVFETHSVYLLSGEKTHAGWNVPSWAWEKCAGKKIMPSAGHLMMLENTEDFNREIISFLK